MQEVTRQLGGSESATFESKRDDAIKIVENKFNEKIEELKSNPKLAEGLLKMPNDEREVFEQKFEKAIDEATRQLSEVKD